MPTQPTAKPTADAICEHAVPRALCPQCPPLLPPHIRIALDRFEEACEVVFSRNDGARPVKAREALEAAITRQLDAARKVNS